MQIYKNRAPFMTRIGQFEAGKQTLVVGSDMETMAKCFVAKEDLYMTVGKSETVYKLAHDKLKTVRHTVWNNPKGRQVWIIPLSEFEVVKKI